MITFGTDINGNCAQNQGRFWRLKMKKFPWGHAPNPQEEMVFGPR